MMRNTHPKLSVKQIFHIVFVLIVVALCYAGTYITVHDLIPYVLLSAVLAVFGCADFVLSLISRRFVPKESWEVWCLFGAIFFIALLGVAFIWWALGVNGVDNKTSTLLTGIVLGLRVVAIHLISKDNQYS